MFDDTYQHQVYPGVILAFNHATYIMPVLPPPTGGAVVALHFAATTSILFLPWRG